MVAFVLVAGPIEATVLVAIQPPGRTTSHGTAVCRGRLVRQRTTLRLRGMVLEAGINADDALGIVAAAGAPLAQGGTSRASIAE